MRSTIRKLLRVVALREQRRIVTSYKGCRLAELIANQFLETKYWSVSYICCQRPSLSRQILEGRTQQLEDFNDIAWFDVLRRVVCLILVIDIDDGVVD